MTQKLHDTLGGPSGLAAIVGRLMDHVAEDVELFRWLDQHSFNDVRRVLHAAAYITAGMPTMAEHELIQRHVAGWDAAIRQCWIRKISVALTTVCQPLLINEEDRAQFNANLARLKDSVVGG